MNRFQIGCFFHTWSATESIGMPLVSGKRKMTNKAITRIHAEKKMKM
ncbi:hypothetical protein KSS87_003944 [Heliosperma pusillum]|nr:hypothetical protein KSS87_003944 [Heliosperma pusillum]